MTKPVDVHAPRIPLPSQTAVTGPAPTAPPMNTPPMTGDKGVGFVTGSGTRGVKVTGPAGKQSK